MLKNTQLGQFWSVRNKTLEHFLQFFDQLQVWKGNASGNAMSKVY